MKIAAFPKYEPKGPSARLRFYQFEQEFKAAGQDITFYPLFEDCYIDSLVSGNRLGPWYILKRYWNRYRILRHLKGVDLIWLEKELFPWMPAVIERWVLRRFPKLVLDYDDAVFNIYLYHRFWFVRRMLGKKIARCIRYADGFISGSQYLDEYASKSGADSRAFVPTCIRLKDYKTKEYRYETKPTIGWIGTPSSAGNLEFVLPSLNRVASQIPFRFVAVGASNLHWDSESFEFKYVPWTEATEVELIREFDIGIMPLEDTPFNQGKCGFKLIQYMACEVPVIASPVGENSIIVRGTVEGLHAKTLAEWESAIRALLIDADMREKYGKAGRARVEENYSVENQFENLLNYLKRVAQGKQRKEAVDL